MTEPLHGIKIVELGGYGAAPFCTMMLADLGAAVIKVEPPGGDPYRENPPCFAKTVAILNLALKPTPCLFGDPASSPSDRIGQKSWCQTCLTLLSLLQRTADIGWMAIDKRSDLRGEIALLQYCFPNESIAGVYHTPNRPLRSNISAESPDFAATLFSKSLNVARRELDWSAGGVRHA